MLEAVMAMALVVMIFVGLGVTINVALRAVQERRAEQQALGVLTSASESFANIQYEDLALNTSDGDHGFLPGSNHDSDGAGPLPAEEVAVHASGSVDHLDTVASGGLTFTTRTFVTIVDRDPTDSSLDDMRRLSTTVSWEIRGLPRERRTETVIARQATGDALGFAFTLEDNAELIPVKPGDQVVRFNLIHNIGTEDDLYDLSFEQQSGWTATLTQQVCTDPDDFTTCSDGFPLNDWNTNSLLDTDTVPAGTDLVFKVKIDVPADAKPGDSEILHVTFLSGGDPTRSTLLEYVLDVDPAAVVVP